MDGVSRANRDAGTARHTLLGIHIKLRGISKVGLIFGRVNAVGRTSFDLVPILYAGVDDNGGHAKLSR